MKKTIIFILITILFAFSLKTTKAQTTTIDDQISSAESDYRHQFDLYRENYLKYQTTRSNWQKNLNLETENQHLNAAIDVAKNRTEVLKAYTRWIRLQLISYQSTFEQSSTSISFLSEQELWLNEHLDELSTVSTPEEFNAVMDKYIAHQGTQDRIYTIAQVQLKLATISSFQHYSRTLYDPILLGLNDQSDNPVISQGFKKVTDLGEQVNNEITSINQFAGAIEADSFSSSSFFRKVNEQLSQLHATQINMLDTMVELESRYVQ